MKSPWLKLLIVSMLLIILSASGQKDSNNPTITPQEMDVNYFVDLCQRGLGKNTHLPIAVWYSEEPAHSTEKRSKCLLGFFNYVMDGNPVSLNPDNFFCGGGQLYCGYTEMPDRIPNFVSNEEHYRATPELVKELVETVRADELRTEKVKGQYLNLCRVDKLKSFEGVEAIVFFATPDVLSGLMTWAYYDTNDVNSVVSFFGAGCSDVITQVVMENRDGGHRSFLGMFDPSARIIIDENLLSFAIPMSRFKTMYETMPKSCLFDTKAWGRILKRIESEE